MQSRALLSLWCCHFPCPGLLYGRTAAWSKCCCRLHCSAKQPRCTDRLRHLQPRDWLWCHCSNRRLSSALGVQSAAPLVRAEAAAPHTDLHSLHVASAVHHRDGSFSLTEGLTPVVRSCGTQRNFEREFSLVCLLKVGDSKEELVLQSLNQNFTFHHYPTHSLP